MPRLAPFDSAWLKWAWATLHVEALEREIDAFANDLGSQPILRTRTEYQSKRHAVAIIITGITPLPDHWGLMLGDIAHSFRAALDNLAWAVVGRGRTPPDTLPEKHGKGIKGPVKTDIAFPIIEDPRKFNAAAATLFPGARRTDVTAIRGHQPFARDRRLRGRHCLEVLATLNNLDKHRELQPLFSLPRGGDIEIVEIRHCVITDKRKMARTKSLQMGTELRTIQVRRTSRTGPDPELKVKPTLTAQIALDDSMTTWVEWLTTTESWIFDLLGKFSPCPVNFSTVQAGFDAFYKSMRKRSQVPPG